jgi:putative ABC transport system ATP-binding protein
MIKNIIEVNKLERIYSNGIIKTYALRDVSFNIKSGEFIAIMGPSGSGKSTLLHQLGLLDSPTNGSIKIDTEDVSKLTDNDKTNFRLDKLGYVFQSYNLLPELNVIENVFLTSMAKGLEPQDYILRAKDILERVGLKDRLYYYPSELSGGQQQRVSIARALVNKPKILFADEPTANLDSDSSKDVIDLFRKLNKEINQTIVMVTHEIDEGKKADKIIWIKDGILDNSKNV